MRILIVKLSSYGDVLQALHCAHFLKKNINKNIQIDWVVQSPMHLLLQQCEDIDEVILCHPKRWIKFWDKKTRDEISHLREKTYDMVFDIQGNVKSALVTGFSKAKKKIGFDRQSCKENFNILVTNQRFAIDKRLNIRQQYLSVFLRAFDIQKNDEFLVSLNESQEIHERFGKLLAYNQISANKTVLVAPFSKWTNKQIPMKQLGKFLMKIQQKLKCHFLFIYADKKEEEQIMSLHEHLPTFSSVLSRMTLVELFHLLKMVDYVIAMDSSLLHLCGLTKTKCFSFFGPTKASIYKPIGAHHGHFQGTCPYKVRFEKRCSYLRTCATGACLHNYDEDFLLQTFFNWINKERISERI